MLNVFGMGVVRMIRLRIMIANRKPGKLRRIRNDRRSEGRTLILQ